MGDPKQILVSAAALRSELAGFEAGALDGAGCARVAEELAATENACAAARVLAAARATSSGAHLARGYKDGESWVAAQRGLTGHQARQELETARRLTTCPETRQAVLSGQISLAQASEITQAEAQTPGVERNLLTTARGEDLSKTRERSREEHQSRSKVEDLHRRQVRARSFHHWRDRQGMVCFRGALAPELGVPLVKRVEDAASRARRVARKAGSNDTWEQSLADGLVDICGPPAKSRRSGQNNELVIVCDLMAWRRGHAHPGEVCQVIGGGPIPVSVAQDFADDAFLKAVLHDGTSIHTIWHAGRRYTPELRTALDLGPIPEFTGRECAQCGQRWGLQYDHVDPVSNDGATSYDNIQALCWTDHQAKTARDRDAGLLGPRHRHGP